MAREINLLENTFPFEPLEGNPNALSYYSAKAKELENLTGSRVTFIGNGGEVIGDSGSWPWRWTITLIVRRLSLPQEIR